ncbi:MAG: hypothetical protein P1U30_04175 [Phycisphaerales bacterium]|nr:hypothetical protein [Phycisphaerales bacterium]
MPESKSDVSPSIDTPITDHAVWVDFVRLKCPIARLSRYGLYNAQSQAG